MLSTAILFAFGLVQAVPASAPGEGAYLVEDPFEIEAEQDDAVAPAPGPVTAEAPSPSQDRLICRSRPEFGSRTRRTRVCLTAAQWQLHRTNMEQQRRDINDWGKNGMPR